jgi:carboxyl-terminal processing protease
VKAKGWFLGVSLLAALAVVVVATGATAPAAGGLYRLVGLVGQAVALVRTSYVEEVDAARLELGALGGMVEAVDPGGAYVPSGEAAVFERASGRPLPPYGLVLGKRSSYPYVLQALPGSPAALAGFVPGELVERVGGEPVRARPIWRALVLLDEAERAGKDVELVVIDRQLSATRKVVLKPGAVSLPGPVLEARDGTPILSVRAVHRETLGAVRELLAAHAGAQALVVDLRQVVLGDEGSAAELTALLAGGELEVRWARREGDGRTLRARAEPRNWRLVACVDTTTARAGELVATWLKDRGAILVGFETYGDTGVRRVHRTSDGQVWLAEEWLLGPDKTPLLGRGLRPDEVVRMLPDADPVLDRALELARGATLKKTV